MGGAPGGGVPGAGSAESAGRCTVSLESDRAHTGPEMTASKRVAKELEDLQKELPRYLGKLFSDDANVLVWHALLLPVSIQGTVASGWGHIGQGGLGQELSLR